MLKKLIVLIYSVDNNIWVLPTFRVCTWLCVKMFKSRINLRYQTKVKDEK